MNWLEHHGIESLVLYYVFNAVTGGMPTPVDASGVVYRWAFSSFQILNGSLARLVATQFPASKVGQSLQGSQPVVAEVKPELHG